MKQPTGEQPPYATRGATVIADTPAAPAESTARLALDQAFLTQEELTQTYEVLAASFAEVLDRRETLRAEAAYLGEQIAAAYAAQGALQHAIAGAAP